jgi:hypothetical protein
MLNRDLQSVIGRRENNCLVSAWRHLFAVYPGGSHCRAHLTHRLPRIGRRLRTIEIAAINKRSARVRGEKKHQQKQHQPFHGSMQTEAFWLVHRSFPRRPSGLHDADVSGKFPFRQGLWIEDLQTPPGQECSNGSLILLAVVLWRAFLW